MTYKKFAINNYVIFRIKEEWQECRIKDILPGESKETRSFILHIIKYNFTHPEPIPDSYVHNSSLENQKKFRFSYRYFEFQFPMFLIHLLKEDKIRIKNNLTVSLPSKKPVKKIMSDFGKFFHLNKASVFEDEIEEVEKGFCKAFDIALKKYLCYDRELFYVEKKLEENSDKKPHEMFGIEHLVRLLYFMMCKTKNEDEIIFEYVYYLCDFLDLNYKKYFVDRKYEELK